MTVVYEIEVTVERKNSRRLRFANRDEAEAAAAEARRFGFEVSEVRSVFTKTQKVRSNQTASQEA